MEELFKELIKEWHIASFPNFIKRDNTDYLHQSYSNIYAIIGPRRAGKTFFVYQIIEHLLETKKCEKTDILFIDFEDIRLYDLNPKDALKMLKAYYSLYGKEPKFLIFDEVQNIPEWSRLLRTFHNKRYKIIITGSSSKLLLDEVSTELRGRYSHTMILPFSFKEYLKYKKIDIEEVRYTDKIGLVYGAFQEYLNYGGFPGILNENDFQKRQLLNEYYTTIYYKDILERYSIKDKKLVESFMRYVLNAYSSLFSSRNLENIFKAEGMKGNKDTINRYFSYLKEAFFILDSQKFGYSVKVQLLNPRKIYLIDPGFIRLGNNYTENRGRILENIVAIELFRKGLQFYYFQNKKECDFVIKSHISQPIEQAIQVTRTLDLQNKQREIDGLLAAIKEYNLGKGFILTYNEKTELEINGYKIYILPVWEWMLNK